MFQQLPLRTTCACEECQWGCVEMPGYLIPPDLAVIQHVHNLDMAGLLTWAEEHLRASPGSVVAQGERKFRIGTLVPARKTDPLRGPCHWYTDGKCEIHATSPYGCRSFDSHMGKEEADARSSLGLHLIMHDNAGVGPYTKVWTYLHVKGIVSLSPEELRGRPRIL